MRTETLSTLKINKLSQEQYDRELANGNIDENAIYLTPDTDLDLAEVEQTLKEQSDEIEVVKGDLTSHTNSSNAQFALIREEFANADSETLKSVKEYSDANKNSAVGEAKAYTDQEIEKLVTDTEFEGVLSTIQDIQNAMATDEELAQALETANGKKVDKGAKGSATQPIYFDDNGAQPIAYTIEKSVPADAKFTDTTYTLIKDATNKKIQLMNGNTLVSEVDDNNTTYDLVTAEKAGLMSLNDKTKLNGIEAEANKTIIDSELSISSENPVQNRVINAALNNKLSFDEEVVNSENSAIKAVPKGSGKYAAVNKVGGMSYKSRNLLEVTATTKTINGVTFTVTDNGFITARGTATALTILDLGEISSKLTVGKTYKMSGMHACRIVKADGTVSYPADSFTYTSDITAVYPYLQVVSGVTTTQNYYPMVIESTETNTIYESYYSGIRNAATTKVIATGKNLLKAPETATVKAAGNIIDNKPCYLKAKHTYIFFFNNPSKIGTQAFFFNKYGNTNIMFYPVRVEQSYNVFTPTEDIYSMRLFYNGAGTITQPMVVEGTEVVAYESYKENVLEIPTGARKIGYGLGINEDCYNYIDFERKVFVKNVEKVILTKNSGTISNPNIVAGQTNCQFNFNNLSTKAMHLTEVLCDKMYYSLQAAGNKGGCYFQSSGLFVISIPVSWLTSYGYTDGANNTTAFKAYLDENPIEVIYPLATPEEIDISEYLPDDNFLEVEAGGIITAVNEYNYDAPTEISFFTSENPEKVIVADKIVGDLVGVAEEAQSLTGLDSTMEELNYLHKNIIEEEGWLVPEEGTTTIELMHSAQGVIGLKTGNTYTFTVTYKDGTTETEDVVAIDNLDGELVPGVVVLQGNLIGDIIIIDKANIDSELNITTGTNHYWYPPSVIDDEIESILVTGTKSDGTTLTHIEETYNKIPEGYLPDNISTQPPIKQYWEWTSSDANSSEGNLGFEKPDGYNRCRILIYDRKFTSDGNLGVYMPLIIPFARNKNSDTSWDEVKIVGRTLADVKLGNGEGENQTWGGTEWVSTVSIDVYFTDKGFMCNYVCGTEVLSTKTVTAGSGYPETYAGQISGVLPKDASVDSILDSSLVWTLGIFPQQNKGNYVEVTWYKD